MTQANDRAEEKNTLLRAAWIAPMDRPAFRDGYVLIRGNRIAEVGTGKTSADKLIDLGDVVLTPGLINAHVHLELSDAVAGRPPPGGFSAWLLERIKQGSAQNDVNGAVNIGFTQCMRFGVTAVGDISRQSTITRQLLSRLPLRVVSFGEVTGMAGRRGNAGAALAAAMNPQYAGERLRVGISPHAPYSVEPNVYQMCLQAARKMKIPLATHLAESADEAEFLAEHRGPFRELWDAMRTWDEHVPKFAGGPIRFAESLGLLGYPTLLAHANYCNDDELAILARGQAGVVYCPRTHKYFGHPPHRWREMLAAGINVAVGTDSCASSPDLNLMDDLRLLHEIAPEISAENLFEMATLRGAKALQSADQIGSLTVGKLADITAWPATGADPLRQLLEENRSPAAMWIGGGRVV